MFGKTAKVHVPKGRRAAAAAPGPLSSHTIRRITSYLKCGAAARMRWGTRARAHAGAPQSLCSSAEKQIMGRDGLVFHLRVIAEGYARRTAI